MRNYKLDGCFVDDEKRFALIHIYKNASISIRNALNMRGKYYNWSDVKDDGLTTICVIRDPFKRVVSSYQYLLRLEDNGFLNKHPVNITRETEFFKKQESPIESFELFLGYIEDNGFYDAVTLPQTMFVADRGLDVGDIDVILIQERLHDDFETFKNEFNLDVELKNDNVSDSWVTKVLNEYVGSNDDIKDRINTIYKDDVSLYESIK